MLGTVIGWMTPQRVRAILAKGMLVYIGLIILVALGILLPAGRPMVDVVGHDFAAFYMSARFFLANRMHELYDFGAQVEFQKGLVEPGQAQQISPFVNPPFSVLLYLPFALPNYVPSLWLWWLANLAALAGAVAVFHRTLVPRGGVPGRRLLINSFLFYPTLATFLYGQNSHFSLLIYVIVFVLLRQRRDVAAGFVLGLLAYKPQLALALVVVLLVQWRWKALLGGLLSLVAWMAAGLAISPAAMVEYARLSPLLFDLLRSGLDAMWHLPSEYPTWGIYSFFGFAVLLLDGVSRSAADWLSSLLTAVSMLLVARAWWRQPWEPGRPGWDLAMAATLALGLLISPHLFLYDLALLLLPFGIVWYHARFTRAIVGQDNQLLLGWSFLLCALTFMSSLLTYMQFELTSSLGLPRVGLQVIVPVITAWALLVFRQSGLRIWAASAAVVTSARPQRVESA